MTTDDPTGAALNRAIAERLGWTDLHMRYGLVWGCAPYDDSGKVIQPPNWCDRLNAAMDLCEAIAIERGFQLRIMWYAFNGKPVVDVTFTTDDDIILGQGVTLPQALARLALAALTPR